MRFDVAFGGLIPGAGGAALAALLRTDTPLTGRQVYGLISDRFSLWSVQQGLAALGRLGLVVTHTVGRASVHTINDEHYSIPALRTLLDPVAALRTVVQESVDPLVQSVILFGSIARGEAGPDSDVDLAVIAPLDWDGRADLEAQVRQRLGNSCDVLAFTPDQFRRLAETGDEPVVIEIVRDGVAIFGSMPSHHTVGA